MVKKSRGGRMTAAKKRAAKGPGGKGMVKNRPASRKILSTESTFKNPFLRWHEESLWRAWVPLGYRVFSGRPTKTAR